MTTITSATLLALSTAKAQRAGQILALKGEQTALRDSREAAKNELTRVREQRWAMEDRIDGIRNTVSSVQACMRSARTAFSQNTRTLQALDRADRYIGKRDDGAVYRLKHGQLRTLQSRSVLKNLLGIGLATRERQRRALEQRAGACDGLAVRAWLSVRRDALDSEREGLQARMTLKPYIAELKAKLVSAIGEEKSSALLTGMQRSDGVHADMVALVAKVEREGREPLVRREVELVRTANDVGRERAIAGEISTARTGYTALHDAQMMARNALLARELALADRLDVIERTLAGMQDTMRIYKTRLSTDSGQGPDEMDAADAQMQIDACKADMSIQRQAFDEQQVLQVQLFQVREMLGLLPSSPR